MEKLKTESEGENNNMGKNKYVTAITTLLFAIGMYLLCYSSHCNIAETIQATFTTAIFNVIWSAYAYTED
jgi:YbbR domain-containing protein